MTYPRRFRASLPKTLLFAPIAAIALGVAACTAAPAATPPPTVAPTLAPTATAVPPPTVAPPTATVAPIPTTTPVPTIPSVPPSLTATPRPTPTATPTLIPPPTAGPSPTPVTLPTPTVPAPTPVPTATPTPVPTAAGPVTVAVQPSRDATLHGPPNAGQANSLGSLFVGLTNTQGARRALVAFDVATAVPAGAKIQSATLTVTVGRGAVSDSLPVTLHRVRTRWAEGTSSSSTGGGGSATTGDPTWTSAIFNTLSWQTPGGDFVAAASASVPVDGVGSYTWASTPLLVADVQSWLNDPASNNGWIVIGAEGASRSVKRLDSREASTPGSRPTLTVTYTR